MFLISFFRLWILTVIKKLSCFQKQEKIFSKENNNLKILNILVIKYFGSGLVVALGGYLSESKVDGFLIMRIFAGIYLIALILLFFVKDKTRERLLSLQNKNIRQDFRKVFNQLLNPKSLKILGIGFVLFISPEYGKFNYIYQEDYLKISKFRYSFIDGSQYFFQMIAIIIYKVRFQKTNVKKYLCFLVSLNLICTGAYLSLTRFYLTPDFTNNFKIVFVLNGLKIFLKQLLYLPILAYWTQKDMVNVEGTMVSLLLSAIFLTITIAYFFGLFLMRILDVTENSL
jgi:hypothetical protein